MKVTLLPFLLLLTGRLHLVRGQDEPATMEGSDGRGNEYCEILYGGFPLSTFTVMWSDTNCDPDFCKVTVDDVRAVHGNKEARVVIFNGVKQVLANDKIRLGDENIDGYSPLGEAEYGDMYEDGSGFPMIQVAEVNVGSPGSYEASQIDRDFQLKFFAGEEVYELVEPGCSNIYTMQSVKIGCPGDYQVEGGIEDLPTLTTSGLLQPPEGWTYRTRILEEDYITEKIDGFFNVLTDELGNAYAQMAGDIDPSLCQDIAEPTEPDCPCTSKWQLLCRLFNSGCVFD